jgi:putative endonuclease
MAKSEQARIVGLIGEAIAERYLNDTGLAVIERNWRCDEGEIDLIVRDTFGDNPGEIVFVEVKTRTSGRFGIGSEAITPEKYRRLHHLARRWCRARGIIGDYRIDVISIDDLVLPTMRHLRRVIL